MHPMKAINLLLATLCIAVNVQSFTVSVGKNVRCLTTLHSSAPSDVGDSDELEIQDTPIEPSPEASDLKMKLLNFCASYDRGFGASPRSRKEVDELIQQLEALNPTPVDAAKAVDGSPAYSESAPLEGAWRMVWTTALDVLNLAASPIASPGAIYQVIEPPIATNIIDFIPRAQSLFPTAFPPTLIRAEVKTRASLRPNNSNRVGLNFEAVSLKPVEVLGMDTKNLPPLAFNLPKIDLESLPGVDPATAPGFFDVTYLDGDMLVIKQNAPGGYFVSVKVDDYDP